MSIDRELSSDKIAALAKTAERGASVRLWMQAPAAQIVKNAMSELAGKDNMRWLTASAEEAEKMRMAAQPYAKFFEVVKRIILEGDAAKQILDSQTQEAPPSRDGQGA